MKRADGWLRLALAVTASLPEETLEFSLRKLRKHLAPFRSTAQLERWISDGLQQKMLVFVAEKEDALAFVVRPVVPQHRPSSPRIVRVVPPPPRDHDHNRVPVVTITPMTTSAPMDEIPMRLREILVLASGLFNFPVAKLLAIPTDEATVLAQVRYSCMHVAWNCCLASDTEIARVFNVSTEVMRKMVRDVRKRLNTETEFGQKHRRLCMAYMNLNRAIAAAGNDAQQSTAIN